MKIVELSKGLLGRITHTAVGYDWAVITDKGDVQHQGTTATPEDAIAVMKVWLGDAAAAGAEEPVAEAAAEPATEATDDNGDEEADTTKKLKGKLPDGFPGKVALDEAGYGIYAKVRKLHEQGKLTDVPGIGEATAGHIGEALSEG